MTHTDRQALGALRQRFDEWRRHPRSRMGVLPIFRATEYLSPPSVSTWSRSSFL